MEQHRASLYGEILFTSLYVNNGQAFAPDEHWDRLISNIQYYLKPAGEALLWREAEQMRLKAMIPTGEQWLRIQLNVEGLKDTKVDLHWRDLQCQFFWRTRGPTLPRMAIVAETPTPVRYFPCDFKHSDFMKIFHQLRSTGAEEILYWDQQRQITELTFSNIFFVKNQTFITPLENNSFYAGLERKRVLSYARKMGIEVIERPVLLDELEHFDYAFGTNAVKELIPLRAIGNKKLASTTFFQDFASAYLKDKKQFWVSL